MKFSLLTFLAFPLLALGCAEYQYCHCTNADGSPDDVSTTAVCDDKKVCGAWMRTEEVTNANECFITLSDLNDGTYHNNCDWRVKCSEKGATGADSNCRWWSGPA